MSIISTTVREPLQLTMVSGNQATTSSTAGNITDLVFSAEANSHYFVTGNLKIGCNNTGGVVFTLTTPSGATYGFQVWADAGASTSYVRSNVITTDGTLTNAVMTYNAASGFCLLKLDITTTNAGVIQFQFASGTNTQTSTIYQLGTRLVINKIS